MHRHLVLVLSAAVLGCSSGSFHVNATEDDTGTPPGDVSYDVPIDSNPDVPPLPCDPKDGPPEKEGIFVSATGSELNDGSADKPVQTIKTGLNVARTQKKARVFLDVGEYAETVSMADTDPGIVIEGGWKRGTAGAWRKNCGKPSEETIIRSGDPIAVTATNNAHLSGLRVLTVKTKDKGADGAVGAGGQSVIGILIKGPTTQFVLDRVIVLAGSGGSGGGAGTSPAPTPGPDCSGITDCSDGSMGATGKSPPPAAKNNGKFTEDGYAPGTGEAGGPGATGKNGTAGGTGTPAKCVSCPTGCMTSDKCVGTLTTPIAANPGKCGCGGTGGGGGLGGNGGGASVAVLIVGAKVEIDRVSFTAGNGGNGLHGGTGGTGTSGGLGSAGGTIFSGCYVDCKGTVSGSCGSAEISCGYGTYGYPVAGGTGGGGGKGGQGGTGAGGPGGPSYAIALANGAEVSGAALLLKPGTGGTGADGAAAGASADKFVQP